MLAAILTRSNLMSAALCGVLFFLANGILFGEWEPLTAIFFAIIYAILMPSISALMRSRGA